MLFMFQYFITKKTNLRFFFLGLEEKPKEIKEEEDKIEEKKPKDDSPRPRPLHKTCSLFMRSIAPTISKAEIVAVSWTPACVINGFRHVEYLLK